MSLGLEIVQAPAFLTKFGKKFNLTFDKKFQYCISNAYKDDKGNALKSYYYYDMEVYKLKYVDGCFNPYLFKCTNRKEIGIVYEENSVRVERAFRVNSKSQLENLKKMYGERFEMLDY